MDHQPARAFRNPHPHHQHHEAETGAGEISQPPAKVGAEQLRIEQHDGADRAHRRADPEAAVDQKIGPAAIARRHQFLNCRVDRGIFAADAGAGEEAKCRIARKPPGQRGRRRRGQIKRKRDEEELLAPDPVGQPAEPDRAEHGAGQIGAVGKADLEIAEMEHRAFFQRTRQRTRQRDLEAVQDPGDAKCQHHAGVETAPVQAVEAGRNIGLDDTVNIARHDDRRRIERAGGSMPDCAACPWIKPMKKARNELLQARSRRPQRPTPRRSRKFHVAASERIGRSVLVSTAWNSRWLNTARPRLRADPPLGKPAPGRRRSAGRSASPKRATRSIWSTASSS